MSDDWIKLAHELGFQSTDIAQIQKEYPDSSGQQCMSMLNLWINEISGQDSGTNLTLFEYQPLFLLSENYNSHVFHCN